VVGGTNLSVTDPIDLAELARRIEAEFERTGTPERAAAEKRYLKSDMKFLGTTLADIRRVTRNATTDPVLDRDGAVGLVEELWSGPTFERRMAATLVLELHARDLGSADLSLIERLIRESRTWALVDVLSGDVVGERDCTFASDGRWIDGLATTTSGSVGRRCSQN
jgi:3-methyladenine DNA glycosylase AlkD